MIIEDGAEIKSFIYLNEEYARIIPESHEIFIGRVMDCGDHDEIFIEIKRDGKTVKTVSVKDISTIEFAI